MLVQTTQDGFLHTYSDAGFYIEQTDTGLLYEEAYDPADNPLNHGYAETDEPIDDPGDEEKAYAAAGRILLGEED